MSAKQKYLPINTKKETCKVNIENILYIQQDLRKVIVHTEENNYSFYGKLNDIIPYVINEENFFRCHYSFVLNFDKVCSMKNQTIIFENGIMLNLGRDKFVNTKQYFAQYMIKRCKTR